MMEHVFKRLDELGVDEVKRMRDANELPTNWNPHIRGWLAMKEKKAAEDHALSSVKEPPDVAP